MTEKRFRVAEHLLETRPWDLFFMVEMGTDRIHHGFWRFTDPEHRLYEPGNQYETAMLDYYRALDEKIGRLLRFADEDTAVLVVSDHGAKRIDGGICVNEWLRREGYLVLKEEPAEPTPLKPDMVDWAKTTAWGEGGYYCRLFLNVAGREPEGLVPADDYERVRDELKAKLEALGDEKGRADRHRRAPAGGALRGAERHRPRPDGLLRRPLLAERSARSAPAPSTSSRTTRAPTTRTTRTRASTSSSAAGVEPGPGPRAGDRATSLRRSSRCSASPSRRRWKGRASSSPMITVKRAVARVVRAPRRRLAERRIERGFVSGFLGDADALELVPARAGRERSHRPPPRAGGRLSARSGRARRRAATRWGRSPTTKACTSTP